MQGLSEFIQVTLKGKGEYECLVSPSGMIVSEQPPNAFLHLKFFQQVYIKHKGRVLIKGISQISPPLILDSDKYVVMAKKNKSLEYLKNKFDCEMI